VEVGKALHTVTSNANTCNTALCYRFVVIVAHSMMSRLSCRMGMGGIWELLDGKIWE